MQGNSLQKTAGVATKPRQNDDFPRLSVAASQGRDRDAPTDHGLASKLGREEDR
jgi:hypothetical protein